MWNTFHRLHCDNCKCYIKTYIKIKPNIKYISKDAKVIYSNSMPTILCEECFNKLNNKENETN